MAITLIVAIAIAIAILVLFIGVCYLHRDTLFKEENIESFLNGYILAISMLTSLFVYSLVHYVWLIDRTESVGLAIFQGIFLGLIVDVSGMSDCLYEKIIKKRLRTILFMIIALFVPFIGIFVIRSNFWAGVAWFYGLIIPPILWGGAGWLLECLADYTKTEDSL